MKQVESELVEANLTIQKYMAKIRKDAVRVEAAQKAEGTISELRTEIERVKAHLEAVGRERAQHMATIQAQTAELQNMARSRDEAQAALRVAEASKTAKDAQLAQLNVHLAAQDAQIAEKNAQLELAARGGALAADLRKEIEAKNKALADLQKETEAKNKALADLQRETEAKNQAEAEFAAQTAEIEVLRAEAETRQQEIDNFRRASQGAAPAGRSEMETQLLADNLQKSIENEHLERQVRDLEEQIGVLRRQQQQPPAPAPAQANASQRVRELEVEVRRLKDESEQRQRLYLEATVKLTQSGEQLRAAEDHVNDLVRQLEERQQPQPPVPPPPPPPPPGEPAAQAILEAQRRNRELEAQVRDLEARLRQQQPAPAPVERPAGQQQADEIRDLRDRLHAATLEIAETKKQRDDCRKELGKQAQQQPHPQERAEAPQEREAEGEQEEIIRALAAKADQAEAELQTARTELRQLRGAQKQQQKQSDEAAEMKRTLAVKEGVIQRLTMDLAATKARLEQAEWSTRHDLLREIEERTAQLETCRHNLRDLLKKASAGERLSKKDIDAVFGSEELV